MCERIELFYQQNGKSSSLKAIAVATLRYESRQKLGDGYCWSKLSLDSHDNVAVSLSGDA